MNYVIDLSPQERLFIQLGIMVITIKIHYKKQYEVFLLKYILTATFAVITKRVTASKRQQLVLHHIP